MFICTYQHMYVIQMEQRWFFIYVRNKNKNVNLNMQTYVAGVDGGCECFLYYGGCWHTETEGVLVVLVWLLLFWYIMLTQLDSFFHSFHLNLKYIYIFTFILYLVLFLLFTFASNSASSFHYYLNFLIRFHFYLTMFIQ